VRVVSRSAALLIFSAAVAVAGCDAGATRSTTAATAPACNRPPTAPLPGSREGMVRIPGGAVRLGSALEPEEAPRPAAVGAFWIDRTEVTNDQFAAFVRATGYRTVAERDRAGAAVFAATKLLPTAGDATPWWRLDPAATWRTPDGEGSTIAGRGAEPVVAVAFEDALAYARWLGRDLPTEAEWERAARGGLEGAEFTWGDDPRPGGRPAANHWQGVFPLVNTGEDGFQGRAPVGCFAPNGFGLYDMAGNVWEWTKDAWPDDPGSRVIKGGSWLCADNYCRRYRPASRQAGDASLGTAHVGFRTVVRE
jgi:formylglycine-generating enzyme required for sulfatase activity